MRSGRIEHMTITLSDGAVSVELPDDLLWIDEHAWTPVEQTVSTSITGAAIVDIGTRVNGRPITLEGDADHAWMRYDVVAQLKAWAAVAGKQLTLTIRATSFDVIFRHQDRPAVDVQPIIDYAEPAAQDSFFGTLKFTEI